MPDLPALAGRLAAVPFAALARRTAEKPLHPRGEVLAGTLTRTGSGLGVPWLDAPATDDVVVRLSRGAGLRAPLPDLLGVAVRVPGEDGPVDLLLSSTAGGPLAGRVPFPALEASATYGSLMGYRCAAGTVRLALLPAGAGLRAGGATLAAALGWGPWRPAGHLALGGPAGPPDPDVRFDSMLHPPPGLVPDGPMARFREPAYAAARAGRSAAGRPAQDSTGSPV
jgi:hypothetical protein